MVEQSGQKKLWLTYVDGFRRNLNFFVKTPRSIVTIFGVDDFYGKRNQNSWL